MSSRGRPLERTRSIEDLHELRLMALLHDLVRKHRRKGAGEMLGVDPRTVKACLEQGALSKWMRTALEAQLLSREKAAMAAQQERIEALEERMEALEQQITSGLGEMRTTMEGEIKALKDEHAGALRQWERRLAQVEAGYGGASAASVEKQPVTTGVTRRRYPELVTVEPALDDEAVFGAAWPLIDEWRTLRASHPIGGKSLSWLVTHERILEMELAMLEKHGLTLPPEPMPLTGHWRRRQLSWRWTALYDTQRARVKRELLRWVRRILTLGLWRK